MNTRLVALLGLSILVHGLILWALILSFPKSGSTSMLEAKRSRQLTVKLLKSQLENKAENALTIKDSEVVSVNDISSNALYQTLVEEIQIEVDTQEYIAADRDLDTISPPAIPEPVYYSLAELDKAPVISEDIDANPPGLLKYQQGGELTVSLWIDEEGNVVKTELVKSELPVEFSDNALASFMRAKFSPGMKSDIPVRSFAKIVVRYEPIMSIAN